MKHIGGNMLNGNDLKIDTIAVKQKKQDVDNNGWFVKIEHIESGITVTRFDRASVKAKAKAIGDLDLLIKIWNRRQTWDS